MDLKSIAVAGGIVGGPFGSSLGGKDYVSHGVPVVRGTNLGAGKYIGGDYVYVTNEKVESDLSRNTAMHGDVVFTQRGTLGQVALVSKSTVERYVISQSQMRLRVEPAIASAEYVYYACGDSKFVQQVRDNAISTGVPHINLGILSRLRIPLPDLPQQRAIAEVLGALDDKIAANTKLVSTIDAIAQTMFKSIEAESSLLPLSETADFVNGKAFTKGASGTGRVVVRIAELNSGIGGSTVYSDADVEDKHVSRAGDILFAWSGSLTLHRWYRDDAIVNQHIFKVIPKVGYPSWLVYELIRAKLDAFKSIAADKATTMGHIQRHHLDATVPVPRPEDIARIGAAMDGLWQRALAAERESLTLAEMREALLPELMSGRLRVKDAEKKVEEVV